INKLLRGNALLTVDSMRLMQTDPGSARADFFVPYFLNAARTVAGRESPTVDAKKLNEAAKLLGEWDRRHTPGNKRAARVEAAFRELVNRTWDELEIPGSHGSRVLTPESAVLAELLADSTSVWWDDRRTPEHETRDDILATSLVAALDSTRAKYGDPAKKGW